MRRYNTKMKPKLLVVTGPTATGKTKLALELAKKNNGEIISADSRQLYQHLDIVTGKDLDNHNFTLVKRIKNNFRIGYYLLNQVKVWLYDIISPREQFSAYDWAVCAKEVLSILKQKQKLPIIVGGSYFYIRSLLEGYSDFEVNPNPKLRQELEQLPILELQQRLQQINPELYQQLNLSDKQNPRRLIRWLEKSLSLNKTQAFAGISNQYDSEIIGLKYEKKEVFYKQIEKRIETRLKQGALEEVELLLKMGYDRACPGLQTIGYQQLLAYLYDELTLEEAKTIWLNKEKQYSKRQFTFMKKNPKITWQTL